MIKLVASDLDGTLLHNYQQTVPKEIYDTIKALHEKGIIFTAASGRQYANIRRLFAPLGFDIPYIAENGSMCVYKEEILATGLTPSKTIRHILDALMEYRKIYHTGHCILSVKDTYYSDSTDERHFKQEDGIIADATISHANGKRVVTAGGNGRLDAVSNAIKQYFGISYELSFYEEHSLTRGSSSKACAYVGVICNGKTYWGVGIDADIIKASIEALTVAVNKIDELKNVNECKDERMVEIMNYIQANYLDVSLDDLAEKFFLSKPYLSKYIKEKSGMTFGDIVKKVRMKKARALLKSSSMTVENIALTVGYQNVEHFNRLFKKAYNITPVQFRNQK